MRIFQYIYIFEIFQEILKHSIPSQNRKLHYLRLALGLVQAFLR